jgi:hypothetical protein
MLGISGKQIAAFQAKIGASICIPCLMKQISAAGGLVKDASIDAGLHLLGDPVGGGAFGNALSLSGTAEQVAEGSAAIQDLLNKVSPRNKAIMDQTIRGICGATACTASEINDAADELSNYPFMSVGSISDVIKVARGSNSDYRESIKKVVKIRAKQLGLRVE